MSDAWNDTVLVEAFDAAIIKYQQMHGLSILKESVVSQGSEKEDDELVDSQPTNSEERDNWLRLAHARRAGNGCFTHDKPRVLSLEVGPGYGFEVQLHRRFRWTFLRVNRNLRRKSSEPPMIPESDISKSLEADQCFEVQKLLHAGSCRMFNYEAHLKAALQCLPAKHLDLMASNAYNVHPNVAAAN